MNYKFPIIHNISQVLPLIAGRKEFIVADKEGGYSVINYVVQMEDTFPPVETDVDAILRECRGMIFNTKTGDIISRRYHKFFNVGERMETSPQFVDLSRPHDILEKLDGSMITPFVTPDDGKIRWGTKMGITDASKLAEEFVASNPIYEIFAAECFANELTPIFEWCSRKQKIVIDYPQDQLILTAIRRTELGTYIPYRLVKWLADGYPIPVVKAYDAATDIRELVEYIRTLKDAEGVIVRFHDGHMLKIKAEAYLQLHRAKDVTKYEKNVLEIILQDKLDDLLPLLDEPYKSMVKKYADDVAEGMWMTAHVISDVYLHIRSKMKTQEKREFAVHHVKNLEDKRLHSFMFSLWDGKTARECLTTELLKSCSSQNRLDNNRWMMAYVTYVLTEENEDV